MYIVTRLISDVHFHITGPKLIFKTYNYRHCDTSMSPKTADYFPSGGVIATLLGNCLVLLYKHECHFVSGISQSNFCIFHNTTESVIIYQSKLLIKVSTHLFYAVSSFNNKYITFLYALTTSDECHALFNLFWLSRAVRNTKQTKNTKMTNFCPQLDSNPQPPDL